jgi:hypothetical protein
LSAIDSLLQQRLRIQRRLCRTQTLLQPLHGVGEAPGLDRFDEIVERPLGKRLHGV